jgi:hypothetical protein
MQFFLRLKMLYAELYRQQTLLDYSKFMQVMKNDEKLENQGL